MQGFCRGCLNKYNDPTDLLQYCESNRRLFIYCTGLQVKRNDTFPFQLCKECYLNMKFSCKFKKQCRNSDRKLKNYLALKKEGECVDFSTFLKNSEDTLTLRLPIVSRSSTPSHQITEDDDNVSTCTSIQNFMTDMLQGEEMLPTEARIIREVIQEEADILDDSLDSHWLQDDMSINNDFGVDFNFSAFSTPRSINNDHCYTPRRFTDNNRDLNYYLPKEHVEKSVVAQKYDMPILDDFSDGIVQSDLEIRHEIKNIKESDKQSVKMAHQTDMPLLDDYDVEYNDVVENEITTELRTSHYIESINESEKDLIDTREKSQDSDVFLRSKIAEIPADENPFAKLENFNDNLFSVSNDFSPLANSDKVTNDETIPKDIKAHKTNEKEFSIILNKGIAAKKVCDEDDTIKQSPLTHELEQYITKAKFKKTIKSVEWETNSHNKTPKILKDDTKIYNEVHQTENFTYTDQNQADVIEKADSPLKRELDHYINKVKLKKNTNLVSRLNKTRENYSKEKKCSIDRNLEIALKSNEEQKFSLDQLLMSPQVSIRSGASTPTIDNILFGGMTPKENDTKIEEIADCKDLDPTGVIEEFLKDNCSSRQSTPKKEFVETKGSKQGFKDINKLQHLKKTISKKHYKKRKVTCGSKDLKKLKELIKFDHDEQSKFSDDSQTDSPREKPVNVREKEILEANLLRSEEKEIKSETVLQSEEKEVNGKTLHPGEIEDLDISISNLINFDDNQSVDLNISISSDFLKDENLDNDDKNNVNDPFKKPFSPDSKYDMDKCFCKICNKTHPSPQSLKLHLIKTHKIIIPKELTDKYSLKICHVCAKEFRDSSNFNKHVKTHKISTNFQCDFCTLCFSTKGKLTLHMRAHASEINGNKSKNQENKDLNSKKKFICSSCGKTSTTIGNFKLHQRRHTKSYTVTCPTCQKGFYRTHDLNLHMMTHNGIYEFTCQYCPKVYRRRDLLVAHIYAHMDKKNYACDFCNKRFVTKQSLKTHCANKTCLKKRISANGEQEKLNQNAVNVTYGVGSTEKIADTIKLNNSKRLKLKDKEDLALGGEEGIKENTVDSVEKPMEVEETEKPEEC